MVESKENGSIYTGETGNWAMFDTDTAIKQRQSMGKQWQQQWLAQRHNLHNRQGSRK